MTPQTVVLLSFALSAVGALAVAPLVIKGLKRLKAGQTVLGYVTQHEHKTGTPTMGGIIFLLPVTVVCLVTMTAFSVLAMCLTLGFAVLGFLDDFIKVRFHRNLGLKAYQKIIGQVGLAAIAAYFCFASPTVGTAISIPAQGAGEMGWGIIPFVMLVYIATTNSVNLTDGLDGLAATTSLGYFAVYTLLALGLTHDAASAGNHADASELGSLAAFSASLLLRFYIGTDVRLDGFGHLLRFDDLYLLSALSRIRLFTRTARLRFGRVHVHLRIGYLYVLLVEAAFYLFEQVETSVPIVLRLSPDAAEQHDRAVSVFVYAHGGRGIA